MPRESMMETKAEYRTWIPVLCAIQCKHLPPGGLWKQKQHSNPWNLLAAQTRSKFSIKKKPTTSFLTKHCNMERAKKVVCFMRYNVRSSCPLINLLGTNLVACWVFFQNLSMCKFFHAQLTLKSTETRPRKRKYRAVMPRNDEKN